MKKQKSGHLQRLGYAEAVSHPRAMEHALMAARAPYHERIIQGEPGLLTGRAHWGHKMAAGLSASLKKRLDKSGVVYEIETGPCGGWTRGRLIIQDRIVRLFRRIRKMKIR